MDTFWNLKATDIVLLFGNAVMIWAVIKAPKWAVEAQWRLQLKSEEQARRLQIFKTLMATRGNIIDYRHVEALNMIDVEFSKPKDTAIRTAWNAYLNHLNTPMGENPETQNTHQSRTRDLLAELLHKMGSSLGYDFDFTYIKDRGYYPLGHSDAAADEYQIRKNWLEVVRGNKALKMEVSASEETAAENGELRRAWLDVAQGKRPLKIEPPDR